MGKLSYNGRQQVKRELRYVAFSYNQLGNCMRKIDGLEAVAFAEEFLGYFAQSDKTHKEIECLYAEIEDNDFGPLGASLSSIDLVVERTKIPIGVT
jgi:hypothetical protein